MNRMELSGKSTTVGYFFKEHVYVKGHTIINLGNIIYYNLIV